MTKYEVYRNRTEDHIYNLPNTYNAKIDTCPECPELLDSFATLEDALTYLRSTNSTRIADIYSISAYGIGRGWLVIAEYCYIIESEYDEDDEFIQGGDVWEWSEMPESFTIGSRTYKHVCDVGFQMI